MSTSNNLHPRLGPQPPTFPRAAEDPRSPEDEVEDIRERMGQLRCGLQLDAARLTRQARRATQWQYYVESFPLACAGLAVLGGFILVPNKREVVTATDDQIRRLAKAGELSVTAPSDAPRQSSLTKRVGLALGAMAVRAALSYAGQQLGQKAAPAPDAAVG